MPEWLRLRRRRVLVVGQSISSLQQTKCVFPLCEGHPKSRLPAKRAIATGCTSGKIEVAFEPDSAAVATTFVCLLHFEPLMLPDVLFCGEP